MAESPQAMTAEDLKAWIAGTIQDSVDHIDDEVSPVRASAFRYYLGAPFSDSGDSPAEEDGRSQVVSREVHDAVHSMLPSLMRVFFSHDKSCEFIPRGPEDVAGAAQATELVSWYLEQSNAYSVFADAIKDCLIKGEGIIKCWHETQYDITSRELQGLNELQIGLFVQEGYEVTSSEELEDAPGLYNVVLTRRIPKGKIRLECLPPEEFLINRTATSLDDAKIVAHRQLLRVGDLVELGYPYEQIIEHKGYEDDFRSNEEWNLRHPNWREEDDTDSDPSNRLVQYVESFVRVDADGDGVPELRRICTIGNAHEILMNEPVDSHPFLLIRKDPLQHTWRGMSLYDELADIQRIKSAVMRNMLDSLSLSTRPRILMQEQYCDWEDVANDEIGAIIPVRAAGAIQMLEMPFVGAAAFPLLQYLDQIKETRTGISKASQGLDAEHLQSTTAIGISASQKAAQARLELIARNIAESGFKPLYKRLLQLTLLHMDQPTVMRLRGEFVQVDPQSFADYDVLITLPLGRGSEEERRQALLGLLEKQEMLIAQYGPMNPIVGPEQYYQTLQRLFADQGLGAEAGSYLRPPQQMQALLQQQMQQVMAQQNEEPKPSPEEMLAQAEIQRKQIEIAHRQEEMKREDDRKRDEMEAELFIKLKELSFKYGQPIDASPLLDALTRNRELERVDQVRQQQLYEQQFQQQPPQGQMPI
jgi:hypothetical protein